MNTNNTISAICPNCGSHILDDIFNVDTELTEIKCIECKKIFSSNKGSVKFLSHESPEEEYYDEKYSIKGVDKSSINFDKLRELWFSPIFADRKKFLQYRSKYLTHSFRDFRGSTVLLLGNGISEKELYLLALGARIIYTDISHNAILYVKEKNNFGKFNNKISFHSMDAERIAIDSGSIDFVIGDLFSHHLDDLGNLFREIERILKKGGLCLFRDGAYSKIWQNLKFTLLKPITKYSHKKSGISPQDLNATHRGGYRKSEILSIKKKYGFSEYIYYRSGFFSTLTERFVIKILGQHDKALQLMNLIIPKMYKIDCSLSSNINFFHKNTLSLFWGFRK